MGYDYVMLIISTCLVVNGGWSFLTEDMWLIYDIIVAGQLSDVKSAVMYVMICRFIV